ncbi:hypothetical protein [Rubrivirga sp.]|uniref:hypothetical protein n=1 Tax=Rubrivirga sp. TaxID=1885344 RepID=UPI003C7729FA
MSQGSHLAFLSLVAFVTLALLAGVWATQPAAHRLRRTVAMAVALASWLGGTATLALSGALSAFDRIPPPAAFLFLGLLAGTVALTISPLGRRLAHGVPLAALVGVQAFRVPLEVLLHRLYTEGVLPVQVTYEGWNYDIATGLLAVPLAVWLWRSRVPAGLVTAWNVLGLILVLIVVATAVLSLPTPFQQVAAEPDTSAIATTAPLIWLPAVLVQAALLGHFLVFRRLLGMSGQPRP